MRAKPIIKRSRSRKGRTDWARVRRQSDAAIARAVAQDPDVAPLADAEWFRHVRIALPEKKTPVYIRLDGEVVKWFKEAGPRYQSRINAVLKAYVRFTRAWNSVRGNSLSSWLNMLENPLTGEPPVCGGVEPWSVSTPPYAGGLIRSQL